MPATLSLPLPHSKIKSEVRAALVCEKTGLPTRGGLRYPPPEKQGDSQDEGPLCYTFRGSQRDFQCQVASTQHTFYLYFIYLIPKMLVLIVENLYFFFTFM